MSCFSIIIDRVRSTREGNVFSLFTLRGDTPARSRWGGIPQPGSGRGYPGGYPTSGTPHQTWLGVTPPQVPPIRPGWGVPRWGYPILGPPIRPGWVPHPTRGVPHPGYPHPRQTRGDTPVGGTPPRVPPLRPGQGVPHRVVLDTPRSVCLLRSRRRTFLFLSQHAP